MISNIAKRWKVLSGEEEWKGLLDPLDLDLRRYIIHYGQLAQATYDAFNSENKSKYAGDCYYSKKHLFPRVGLIKNNPFKYNIRNYFYATSQIRLPSCFIIRSLSREAWNKESNWMGFIAVATDEAKASLGRRDIVVAWRGTIQVLEWASDFDFPLVPASRIFPGSAGIYDPSVASGWLSLYTSADTRSPYSTSSAREQVLEELKKLLEEYKDEELSITLVGHSLGGTLATLCAADITANGLNIIKDRPGKICPVTVFSFASPFVGDRQFKNLVDSLENLYILRIRNLPDTAPYYPLVGYQHVGQELMINTILSKYLKESGSFKNWHNMEVYLHGVAGTQGRNREFKLEIKRDIALVNKGLDGLKDSYLVPENWWCTENKGMVQMDDLTWQLRDHEAQDENKTEDE